MRRGSREMSEDRKDEGEDKELGQKKNINK